MRLCRLDDYQSWLVEVQGRRIAIDPWLTDEFSLPPGHWLFGRRRSAPSSGPAALAGVDALVLTAHFSDHLHPATLEALPRGVPVVATSMAATLVRRLGFTNVRAMRGGETAQLLPGVDVEAIAPAFPYSHNSLGYLLHANGVRLYLETHTIHADHAAKARGADCLITPVQSVRLLGMPLVMSPERALAMVEQLQPKRVVPTGNDPDGAHGLLQSLALFTRGSVEAFGTALGQRGLPTTFHAMRAGDALEL
ncbi:MAG: MBL fold metallo-hydrolase [Myxococcales bacterium]|nr:MBL fold metallo-hydrolase [Myxococcales bacterium]